MGGADDISLFTTDASLVVRTWGGWLGEVTGIAREDAIGRNIAELVPDIARRGLLPRFEQTLTTGAVHVLAPALHHYLIACPPRAASANFDRMQQRVTIGPLRESGRIVGVLVAIEDVTARLDGERELADALASDDPDVRRKAAERVAEMKRLDAAAFAPALASDNWRVRQAAVRGLANTADPGFMHALVKTLRQEHRNFALLSSALKLLAATDADVTAPLAELLRDEDADLRIQAALALGEQHDAGAVTPLIAALHDSDANVRFQAIESLGRLRAEAAVDELLQIVEAGDFFLSFAALDALSAIGDPRVALRLVPLLERDAYRVPVADALAVLGDEQTVAPLALALNRSSNAATSIASALARVHDRYQEAYSDGARIADLVHATLTAAGQQHVVQAVRGADKEQLPGLVRVLSWCEGPDVEVTLARLLGEPAVRSDVIEALVRHGTTVIDQLVEQLSIGDRETQHAAIIALGRLGNRRATRPLVALLEDDTDLLIPVAGALARIGDRDAFEPLLRMLDHPDASARQSVIGALNSIGHPDLPGRVAELLRDENPLVRESAVRIAGYFGYPETVDQLFACVDDQSELVRKAAIEHIAFLEDPRVLPTLAGTLTGDTASARAAAARAFARVDDGEAGTRLVSALGDDDSWVRYFAARSIAERGECTGIDVLLRLAEQDPAAHVRIAAVDALGLLRVRAAVPLLERFATDVRDDLAAAALAALGHIAQPEGLAALQEALRSESPARRMAALEALAVHGSTESVASLEWSAAGDVEQAVARAAIKGLADVAARPGPAALAAIAALTGLLSDAARRDVVAAALARLPEARIADVARGLAHPHPSVRIGIVEALGRFQRETATNLIVAAAGDSSPAVREAVVVTLTRLGARAVGPLFGKLATEDPSKAVRRAAAKAMTRG